jgi:hypothetical protein
MQGFAANFCTIRSRQDILIYCINDRAFPATVTILFSVVSVFKLSIDLSCLSLVARASNYDKTTLCGCRILTSLGALPHMEA